MTLLKKSKQVDIDGVLGFADATRALVEDVLGRLASEVVEPLTEFEQYVDDPAATPLSEASRQVRGAVGTVQANLGTLVAVVERLRTQAVA